MSGGAHTHDPKAPPRIAILTISDTRTLETDSSGAAIESLASAAGWPIAGRAIVRDEPAEIAEAIRRFCADPAVDAVVATGGTGVAPRDRTPETLEPLFERRLDGFGELFRTVSFQEVGARAILSRATAGVISGRIVFALPGSEAAVRLAMERLLIPVAGHIVAELKRRG